MIADLKTITGTKTDNICKTDMSCFVCLLVLRLMAHLRKYGHIVPNTTIFAKIKGVLMLEYKPVS